ncbi:MAG: DUF2155 domain-containing protein [Alphaproteobacteria bacterium]|nr:DUF2155 domain-containing protein [Alphaproteobacteria bacterium]MBQ3117408.1 DUF2155 domain-containing protein [Alphaproteobacteria bacterium]MBQ8558055.1 DUF2155 domain-containing protein [Alphaproteobacteria bacterium]MBR3913434.1 DUF2155 domain-containing protein [Alphaproteobacteria bacterium]
MRLKLISFVFFLGYTISSMGADISTQKLILRGVDKITGRVSTMPATVNEPLQFGDLTIVVERCLTKPQEETPENAAFIRAYEKVTDNPNREVFKGWMFSSNPALSAMEHPIYDIWVIQCVQNDIVGDVVSPEKVTGEQDLHLIADDDNPALATD